MEYMEYGISGYELVDIGFRGLGDIEDVGYRVVGDGVDSEIVVFVVLRRCTKRCMY